MATDRMHPDAILDAIADRNAMWALLSDVQESYTLAMRAAGITSDASNAVTLEVTDYLANYFGDGDEAA